jgi:6-phosphogluconolactonase
MPVREIVVCRDPNCLAHAAAQFILGEIALIDDRRFHLALSGGSTPAIVYDVLASNPASGKLLNSACEFYFSDERTVGPDHPDSNFGLANSKLFEPLGVEQDVIHRMIGEAKDPQDEVRRYVELILSQVPVGTGNTPRFDLTILGMGSDGHTASIFPDYDYNRYENALVAVPFVNSLNQRRLTFTLKLINASRAVLILVSGKAKAAAVKSALDSSIESSKLPVSRVAAERTVWLLDLDAASELNWTGNVLSL